MDSVKIYTVEMILSSMTLTFWSFCRYIYHEADGDKQYGAHTIVTHSHQDRNQSI